MRELIQRWVMNEAHFKGEVKHGGNKQVLSIGQLQSPTLAMVVDRFKEIENFKPQSERERIKTESKSNLIALGLYLFLKFIFFKSLILK